VTPDFDKIATLLASNNIFNTASELHGIICGQLCAGAQPGDAALSWRLLGQESKPNKLITDLILRLQANIHEQLSAEDFSFQLLLPDEDEELSIRLHALGNWCEGFISGFGGAYAKGDSSLLEETREVLKDFTAIANVDDRQHEQSEHEEHDFMEVTEYVRMAACTVFIQHSLNTSNRETQTPDKNRLH
tara:strand:- start:2785 stop:3351 length:567 start_codon:yes stop_codon:yes gene_type:complete